jgi:large subunit ribosomal protein L3
MTQLFVGDGEVVPVSVIKAGPCFVLEKKSASGKDGYSAMKLGYEPVKDKHITAPERGYFKKLQREPLRHVQEIRISEEQVAEIEVGAELKVSLFTEGDMVNVEGKTRGRGFQGVIKRWGFKGKRQTHGTHKFERHGGSVGSNTWPARTWPGKKMAGQFGNTEFTAQNLQVVKVIPEQDLILIRGSVPGARNSLVLVRTAVKKWKRA